ncbi:MAG: YfhO family protein [Candidatus Sumerlaeaceae bacterium]|nr:YfhO family protein [Candidatus Sumerlaeaceae bacterium]
MGSARSRDTAALLILLGCVLILNGWTLAGGIPYDTDNILFGLPFFALFRESPFPLWDPYQLCGLPLIGNLQYMIFYPLRLAFLWADAARVYGPFCFVHWVIGAWGAYWLGRVLHIRRGAAVFGAITFACGSYIQGRALNPSLFFSSVWLPSILAAAIWTFRDASIRGASATALLLAVMAFAGSPHNIFFSFVMLAILVGWRMTLHDGGRATFGLQRLSFRNAALLCGMILVLFTALFSPVWWHALELLPRTIRAEAKFEDITADSLRLWEVPKLWFGGLGTPEYGDKTSYCGMCVLLLLLATAVTGAAAQFKNFWRGAGGYGMALCVVGILIALGATGGVYYFLYAVPGFRFLIGPARGLVLFNVGWSIVAMMAAHQFLESVQLRVKLSRARKVMLGVVVLCLLAGTAGLIVGPEGILRGAKTALLQPQFANPDIFPIVSSILWGGMAALVIILITLFPGSRIIGPLLLCAIQFANLWHFHSRVWIRHGTAEYFVEPATVRFLKNLNSSQPWRVMAWAPFRLHSHDIYDTNATSNLASKLSDYYRILEVQGYDPMMLRDYVGFMTAIAGRSNLDDPFRAASAAQLDSLFANLTGVRFIIGNPWNLQVPMNPDRQSATITDSRPVESITITSLADHAANLPQGTPVGAVRIEFSDGSTTSVPVRLGMHTADVRATDPAGTVRHSAVAPNLRWRQFDPRMGGEAFWANYLGRFELGLGKAVRRISWVSTEPGVIFLVQNFAVEFTPTQADADRFQRVWREGRNEIWENRLALPLAYLATETTTAATMAEIAAILEAQRDQPGKVAVLEPGNPQPLNHPPNPAEPRIVTMTANHWTIEAETSGTAVLVVSQAYYPGWCATVDGVEQRIFKTNGTFQGIVVEAAGRHTIELRYSPLSLPVTLVIAFVSLLASIVLLFLRDQPVFRPS